MSIFVNVVNQKMYLSSNADVLVDGSQQFVQFKFNLSSEWDGLMTFAQFRQGTKSYNQYLDEDNCVYLPAEIGVGTCTLMLYGSHNTTIGTTNYLTLKIGPNNLVSDAESTDISQSLYDQLVTKINNLTSSNGQSVSGLEANIQGLRAQIKEKATQIDLNSEIARAKASEEANAKNVESLRNEMLKLHSGTIVNNVYADEIYFMIDADGTISLKPEYRGACTGASYTYGHSDIGEGIAGTRNKELPEEIVIPETVNGTTVTALPNAMFKNNLRVKRIILPKTITEIPLAFCARAHNLEEVSGTENIKKMYGNAFAYTNLRKAYFPSLEEFAVEEDGTPSGNHFLGCANLVVADLGSVFVNAGATVPRQCFSQCEKLEVIRNADGITVVYKQGLYLTYRLSNKNFLPNLTSIGACGLLLSRVDYDWSWVPDDDLENSSCINNYAYQKYTGNGYITPMRSTFEQHDPRWADKYVGNVQIGTNTYSSGCMAVSAAMVYSALMGVDMESPEEFVAAVGATKPELLDMVIDTQEMAFNGMIQWLDAVGLEGKYYSSPSVANVEEMYSALESGALVIARVLGDCNDTNHVVVFHGINKNGELLVVNPSSVAREIGVYDAITYAMPIQNMMRDATGATNTKQTIEDAFVIVTKKAT